MSEQLHNVPAMVPSSANLPTYNLPAPSDWKRTLPPDAIPTLYNLPLVACAHIVPPQPLNPGVPPWEPFTVSITVPMTRGMADIFKRATRRYNTRRRVRVLRQVNRRRLRR